MFRPVTAHDPVAPLYHPTSVVLVDDDPDFLHALVMRLRGAFQCVAFRSVDDAVAHVRGQWRGHDVPFAADAMAPPGTLEYIRDPVERALHLQASRLPRVFADASRFARASVIVADPALTDLGALHALSDPPLRKLLLPEAGPDSRAGLTETVLSRKSAGITETITDHLHRLQLEFFRALTGPIEPALIRADARFLLDPAVRDAFAGFVADHAIIEYCACLHPPGILGLDRAGNPSLMIVVDDDYRQASFEIAHAEGAPTELLRRLARGDAIAVFPTANGFYVRGLAGDWRDHLWQGRKLGDNGWMSATIDEPEVARMVCGSIASYDSYRRRRLN